jgi:acetyl-CoA C-acetyltransferase
MSNRDVFICAAARTPIGAFQGALQELTAPKLGTVAIQAALSRSGLGADDVAEVFMGNVLSAGIGQAPARQASARSWDSRSSVPCDDHRQGLRLGPAVGDLRRQGHPPRRGRGRGRGRHGVHVQRAVPTCRRPATATAWGNDRSWTRMIFDGLWDPVQQLAHGQRRRALRPREGLLARGPGRLRQGELPPALAAQKEGASRPTSWWSVEVPQKKGDAIKVTEDEEPGRR